MARRPRNDEEANMDSLLDALTNVVGILLLVLILTSLNMSQVVKKIASNLPEISVEQAEQMKLNLEESRKNRERLETTWVEMEEEEAPEKAEMMQVVANIDELEEKNQDITEKLSDLDSLKALIAEEEEKKEKQEVVVNEKDMELSALKAALDDTPEKELPEPEILTLPNPRLAPDQSEPRVVLLRHDKAYYLGDAYRHLFAARTVVEQNFKDLVYTGEAVGARHYTMYGTEVNDQGRPEPLRNREDIALTRFRYDGKKVVDFFQKNNFGGKDFSYKAHWDDKKDTVELRIFVREEGGMTVEEFKQRNSVLDLAFKRIKGDRDYVLFLVSPDSFRAYTQARAMSEFYNIPAGWLTWISPHYRPKPKVVREYSSYVVDDAIPVEQMQAHADTLSEMLTEHADAAELRVPEIEDPELREIVDRWARGLRYAITAAERTPTVAETFREEDVRIQPDPPNIPGIYVFKPQNEPKEVPPPPPDKPEPDKPGVGVNDRDVLD